MRHTSFVCTALISIVVLAVANLILSPTLVTGKDKKLKLEDFVTIVEGDLNGMPGPHIIITGANLHIRSGEGVTNGANTGVGNLVIGYNEEPPDIIAADRDGTHNLIVGPQHKYLSFGGFLAGFRNNTSGDFASVSGGVSNTASGIASSVSGGQDNTASGDWASVSGGVSNTASGDFASVSGGVSNTASGDFASVSGGNIRTAAGSNDWVAGALFQDF